MARPVQDDNVARMKSHLARFELEVDRALQHDVEVRRRSCVHPGPCSIGELRHALDDIAIQGVVVAGGQQQVARRAEAGGVAEPT